MNSYDMLSLGPAQLNVLLRLPDEAIEEVCSIDEKRCMIELGFGDKIPVKKMDFAVGGNAGNNAVGLARLGHKVAIVGTMGDGWSDRQAVETLRNEGVNTDYMQVEADKAGLGVIINYAEERTILSYYPDLLCRFPDDPDLATRWMYLTTAGLNYENFYRQAVDWAKEHGAKIAFNPGSRQLKDGMEKIKFVMEAAEVLFVNKEEAEHLLGKAIDCPVKDLLVGLWQTGVKLAVVTDGMGGSYSYDGQKFLHMPIVPATVVERTGAGDAFGSGFLAALLHGEPVETALRWGTCNSAAKLGVTGPQAGLLNQQEMQEWLEKTKTVVPTTLGENLPT